MTFSKGFCSEFGGIVGAISGSYRRKIYTDERLAGGLLNERFIFGSVD